MKTIYNNSIEFSNLGTLTTIYENEIQEIFYSSNLVTDLSTFSMYEFKFNIEESVDDIKILANYYNSETKDLLGGIEFYKNINYIFPQGSNTEPLNNYIGKLEVPLENSEIYLIKIKPERDKLFIYNELLEESEIENYLPVFSIIFDESEINRTKIFYIKISEDNISVVDFLSSSYSNNTIKFRNQSNKCFRKDFKFNNLILEKKDNLLYDKRSGIILGNKDLNVESDFPLLYNKLQIIDKESFTPYRFYNEYERVLCSGNYYVSGKNELDLNKPGIYCHYRYKENPEISPYWFLEEDYVSEFHDLYIKSTVGGNVIPGGLRRIKNKQKNYNIKYSENFGYKYDSSSTKGGNIEVNLESKILNLSGYSEEVNVIFKEIEYPLDIKINDIYDISDLESQFGYKLLRLVNTDYKEITENNEIITVNNPFTYKLLNKNSEYNIDSEKEGSIEVNELNYNNLKLNLYFSKIKYTIYITTGKKIQLDCDKIIYIESGSLFSIKILSENLPNITIYDDQGVILNDYELITSDNFYTLNLGEITKNYNIEIL